MTEEFNPFSHDRPPRSEGYSEETRELFEAIQENRGDQRIGQFLVNAVRTSNKFEELNKEGNWKEQVEGILWCAEAPELLKMVEHYTNRE